MLSIIGAIIGFAGSTLPSVIDHFKQKESNRLTLDVIKAQGELAKVNSDIDLMKYHATSRDTEHSRLIEHDIALANQTGALNWLRSSVRPIITYLFFFLFATVKISAIIVVLNYADVNKDGNIDPVEFNTAMQEVWDEETQGIFAAIISFWFGRRAMEKMGR